MKKTANKKKLKKRKAILRKAHVNDAPQIRKLIMYYAKKEEMLPRSLNEIYENIRDFSVIEENGKVIACSALHVCWEDLAEIKSLAVDSRHSRLGLGSRLARQANREALKLGIPQIFTLTFQADFFEKLGYRRVEMNELPKKIWFECVKCVHFPDCDEEALVIDL